MKMKRVLACGVLAATAGTAFGQSYNIDFNAAGRAAPLASYGAAAGVAGTWNAFQSAAAPQTQALSLLNGVTSKATITHSASGGMRTWTYGAGDFARVMDDVAWAEGTGEITVEIKDLDPGAYRLWVYAGLAPGQTTYTDRDGNAVLYRVNMDVEFDGALIGSQFNQGANASLFALGTNYNTFNVVVPQGCHTITLAVRGDAGLAHAKAALAGVQVVRLSDTLHVVPGGAGAQTGLNWANAMSSIQTAIDTAAASGGVYRQVWVAEGQYKPTTTSDRTRSFILKNNVAVYGGFAGDELSISQRVLGEHPSVLSGDIGAPRVATDNSFHVVTAPTTNRTAVLDGFSIHSGNANQVITHDAGGGILGVVCSATFRNLTISYNDSIENGGGVAINSPNAAAGVGPIFDRCTFYQNESVDGSGGGLFYAGATGAQNPELYLINCEFTRNVCHNFGGGAYIGNTYSTIQGCVFNGNNAADGSGGGLFAGWMSPNETTARIRNCTFAQNQALGVGGLDTNGVKPNLYNSILWGNTGTVGSIRHQNLSFTASAFDIDYNVIQGYQPAEMLGTGNRSYNPLFVDANGPNNIAGDFDDDLRLADTSPAIDAANNNLVGFDWADLDGDGVFNELTPLDMGLQARNFDGAVTDTGVGPAPIIDMGAFENQTPPAPPCPVDFNEDGFLDFFDYDAYVTCFEGNGCPPGKTADFNGDDFTDFFDYDAFVLAFEIGC
jgi:hypothetical protein